MNPCESCDNYNSCDNYDSCDNYNSCDICFTGGTEEMELTCGCKDKHVCLDCLLQMKFYTPCPFCRAALWGDYRGLWLQSYANHLLLSQVLGLGDERNAVPGMS